MFIGLVEVPVNSRSKAECPSRSLGSEESAEIPAWFTAGMIRRINRVVDTNSLYCHIVQFLLVNHGCWLLRALRRPVHHFQHSAFNLL
jgi:hypothetical protein